MNGLMVMSYALSDAAADDGGFAVVPGSHKANFAVPKRFISLEKTGPWVVRVPVKAGDVDHLQRGLYARDMAVARSTRAAEPALQVRARTHGVGVAVPVAGGRARDRLLRAIAADSRPAVCGARAGRVRRPSTENPSCERRLLDASRRGDRAGCRSPLAAEPSRRLRCARARARVPRASRSTRRAPRAHPRDLRGSCAAACRSLGSRISPVAQRP